MGRTRIGVLVRSFRGKELAALKYLVLEQNRHQTSFEFEILPAPDSDPFLEKLGSRTLQDRTALQREMTAFVKRYREWLVEDASGYDIECTPPPQIVIVSNVKFADYYYLTGMADWTLFALGWWKRSMAPPSVVEFILTLLAGTAIDSAVGMFLPSHHSSRGCISDFTANLDEARIKALTGYLCADCLQLLEGHGTPALSQDAVKLLTREWLGSVADPATPGGIAKKLGYDLFRIKGFKPTAYEKAIEALQEEWVKETIKLGGAVMLAVLLVLFGLKEGSQQAQQAQSRAMPGSTSTSTTVLDANNRRADQGLEKQDGSSGLTNHSSGVRLNKRRK